MKTLTKQTPAFLLALFLTSTVVTAACDVCGGVTCDYASGGPCSFPSTVKICDAAPRDAEPGESGWKYLDGTAREADCWSVTSTGAGDWYQGPCSAGPPSSGTWFPLGSCGFSSGQCCWTSIDYLTSGANSSAGFILSDCDMSDEDFACVVPIPRPH